jgi:pimeloyl-ACP methyl ester carboxylesterase
MTLKKTFAFGLALLAGLLLQAGCSPRRGYEAVLVLADIAAREQPSRLKQVTPAPHRQSVAFAVDGRPYRGDLYLPGESPRSALLLVPGAAEEGKDDSRLVAFATTLARARFTILVPDIASLRELQVNHGNVREIGDAFAWLVSRHELAPGGRGGMVAFSYAAGPAILAALEPGIRDRTGFILAVGGYHDLLQVLTFFTTGWFRQDGNWQYLEPNEYGKWVFVLSNLNRLDDPADRALLRAMAKRKMADLAAGLDDLAAQLHGQGRALYAFIVNHEPQRVPELLRQLPPGIRADIAALDLANKDLVPLGARLLLIHGYDDSIIPYTESIALARAVPEGQARLFLVDGLAHVDLEPGLRSRFRLWRAIYLLLGEREADNR